MSNKVYPRYEDRPCRVCGNIVNVYLEERGQARNFAYCSESCKLDSFRLVKEGKLSKKNPYRCRKAEYERDKKAYSNPFKEKKAPSSKEKANQIKAALKKRDDEYWAALRKQYLGRSSDDTRSEV